jgi:hypothetical protein
MAQAEGRIIENNRLFREANERIRATSSEYSDPVDPIPFLCECPREDCTAIVRLSPSEYSAIRANSTHFFTATGHELNEEPVGEVVARHDGYVIVEKS